MFMNPFVKDVDAASFQSDVLDRSHQVPVVVDFWAEWCGPCKILGPTLERVAEEGGGSWELAKLDVDANQQLAMQFRVQGIPTVIAFKDGQPVDQFTGAVPEAKVREFVGALVPSPLDMEAARGEMLWEQGDDEQAEAAFRSVLATDPTHQIAGLGLAGMLLERNESEAALEVLGRLAPTQEVRQLAAAARLGTTEGVEAFDGADPSDPNVGLGRAKALVAAGRYEEALTGLLSVVELRHPELSDQARSVMVDVFELLGNEDPLTQTFRRKLASALY
jgi:putative thioredoxin